MKGVDLNAHAPVILMLEKTIHYLTSQEQQEFEDICTVQTATVLYRVHNYHNAHPAPVVTYTHL